MLMAACGLEASTQSEQSNQQILFKDKNYFEITGSFTEKMRNDFTRKVMTHEGKELLIYLDSPGGSVFAVSRMIGVMDNSNIKFVCVARFAASAAFMLFQNCNTRIMLPDGVLMSHNASGSFRGELPRVKSLFEVIEAIVDNLEERIIKRMNMDRDEYKALINKNLWMDTSLAEKYNAVDVVSNNVRCAKDLIEKKIKTVTTTFGFFGPVQREAYKSACPLLSDELDPPKNKQELMDDFRYLQRAYKH